MKDLKIGTLAFRNPVLTASGTFGMGEEFTDFLDCSKLGGITLKTVTRLPRKGNPPPRLYETTGGLLNSIGLENEGFEKVLNDLKKEDTLKGFKTNVVFSIAGEEEEDFAIMAEAFSQIEGIAMLELNLSCPNVREGGATFDSNPKAMERIVKSVSKSLVPIHKPFAVKISPMQNIPAGSKIVEDNGGHAVTVSNTFLGTAIDIKTGEFIFKNKVAGLSGPAVKPIALYNVYRAASAVKIPVIASGGICSTTDAAEFIMAGAKFVSIGTMNFIEPGIAVQIAEELERFPFPKG